MGKTWAIAATMGLVLATGASAGETVIGRWCDRTVPALPKYNRIVTVVIADDGAVVARSQFNDGSSHTRTLHEAAGGLYEVVGSAHGDKLRIVAATGELQLLDDDGLIRIATRLENTPQSNECAH